MVERYHFDKKTGLSVTSGISRATQEALREMAMENASGSSPSSDPVLIKRRLTEQGARVAFQRFWMTHEGPRAYGYVAEGRDKLFSRPACWGTLLQSSLEDELEPVEEVKTRPRPMMALKTLLNHCELPVESFIRLVCRTFDALEGKEVVLVAMDEGRRDCRMLSEQLIHWVYCLLPYAMRRRADFTTRFDHGIPDRYVLGLVPRHRIATGGSRVGLLTRKGYFSGGGWLYYKGEEIPMGRRTNRKGFAQSDLLYRRWLSSMIRGLYGLDAMEATKALEQMDRVYAAYDELIRHADPGRDCDPRLYGALCWSRFYRGRKGRELPFREVCGLFEDLLTFGPCPMVKEAAREMLDTFECEYAPPAQEEMIGLLAGILILGGEGLTERARELLCAFMARDMETELNGESSAVTAHYLRVLERSGVDRRVGIELLERVFFPGEFPLSSELEELASWEGVGVSRTPREGMRRCSDWVSGYANVCTSGSELIRCGSAILRELEGVEPRRMEVILKALLRAQETRFHYARFEVAPADLVECLRLSRQVEEGAGRSCPKEAKNYYLMLYHQLSRNLEEYLEDRCSLDTILSLWEAFRNERGDLPWSTLTRLAQVQSGCLGRMGWDALKTALNGEGPDVLDRLWQALEVLDRVELPQEHKDQVTHQVCRWLLHSLPEFFEEDWILNQVREVPELDRGGYYQELLALRDFLRYQSRTTGELENVVRRYGLSHVGAKDLMKVVFRLYRRGSLKEMDLAAIQGIYVIVGGRMKVTQLETLGLIADRSGLRGLAELLDQFPSASFFGGMSKRKRKEPREGRYRWLTLDRRFMETLARFCEEERRIKALSLGDGEALWALMEAIDRLSPVGTVHRGAAVRANRNLCRIWAQDVTFMQRLASKSRRKRMLAE